MVSLPASTLQYLTFADFPRSIHDVDKLALLVKANGQLPPWKTNNKINFCSLKNKYFSYILIN